MQGGRQWEIERNLSPTIHARLPKNDGLTMECVRKKMERVLMEDIHMSASDREQSDRNDAAPDPQVHHRRRIEPYLHQSLQRSGDDIPLFGGRFYNKI